MTSSFTWGILGAQGRLGSLILDLNASDQVVSQPHFIAKKGQESKILETSLDVFLDVSRPEGLCSYLEIFLREKKSFPKIVVGSTGWTPDAKKILETYSAKAPVLVAPNFSLSVHLISNLLEKCSSVLTKLGYTSSIHEIHHQQKKDAPSGTALLLADQIKKGGQVPQMSSVRAAKIIGTHRVSFFGPEDIIEINHEALDRKLFARGALMAVQWLGSQPSLSPGLYSMKDVLEMLL